LFRNGACIGALTIYAHSPDTFDDDGRTLLKEMAADISFALDHFAQDAARRAAEEALRESLERFQLANRATFNVLWDWDVRTDALWWNQNFHSTFGYRADEIEPGMESWMSRIHPEDHDRVETGIKEAIASRADIWSDQYRFRRADGAYAVVVDRGYINRDADGRALRVIGAMEDITERERTEAKVANQLDELRRWYTATLGREGRVLEVKKEVNQLLARLGEPPRYPSVEHTGANRDTANPQS
jgi:PAS domain S-box-containing protein